MAEINRIHVSPGVYTSDMVDMKAAANSVGVTKLAVVGETLKGPAFQPYWIHSPKEYASVFGGTSTKTFYGSKYPKYELPYIANEFLKKGTELCVVRTLGFSGYNAGPAWVITGQSGSTSNDKVVIAVLRSRGSYGYNSSMGDTTDENGCTCASAYDSLTYQVGETNGQQGCDSKISYNVSAVTLSDYYSPKYDGSECSSYNIDGRGKGVGFSASYGNLGRFTINCIVGRYDEGTSTENPGVDKISIPVSLNKSDKDYILKVLGTSNDDGEQPLYVETLYDKAWEDLVFNKSYTVVNSGLTFYNVGYVADYGGIDPINGILKKQVSELKRSDVGKRFLYADEIGSPDNIEYYIDNTTTGYCENCYIYTVTQKTDTSGKKTYVYTKTNDHLETQDNKGSIVYNLEDGLYYKNIGPGDKILQRGVLENDFTLKIRKSGTLKIEDEENNIKLYQKITDGYTPISATSRNEWNVIEGSYSAVSATANASYVVYDNENGHVAPENKVGQVTCDLNDYKSSFRYASTPWIVSNVKGDAKHIELNKLFRFHTISDGNGANTEVKVSIENIRPDSGEFDVVVRSYYDTDYNVNVLERFSRCTMAPGNNSIAYKIGTLDGSFESKSRYITVEIADSLASKNSVPCGFLGYSEPLYSGVSITSSGVTGVSIAPITYNLQYDEDTPNRKQYFGLSDITGYDEDYFTFKGNMASIEGPDFVTHGFHLDCRVDKKSYSGTNATITVDGVSGYVFDSVSINARSTYLNEAPIISNENEMYGSIYEDVRLRKFTVMFAGGFDGWDEYRDHRTNTDDFAYANYKGYINTSTGVGYGFDIMKDADSYGIEGVAITSDYYSTLAGVSLLKNPEETDINLLATPGIDTINNTKLVEDVFNIIDERADTFYIVTTPDKDMGSSDYVDDIKTVDETVYDFEDKEVYDDNSATYYPWVKIEDNGEYIWIPPTRDVVRNLAESDNTNTTMNLAPAGTTRGKVDAIRARKNIKNGESDDLYNARINPVRTFAQEGIVIMGQKTLRLEDDIMNRVDVRRMILRMRKLISIACLGLIFEPNDNNTVKSFRSIISGVMQTFMDNRAIKKWSMDVDDSQEARDRLELNATIYVMPIRALEYITLNFVVTNNDVYFEA